MPWEKLDQKSTLIFTMASYEQHESYIYCILLPFQCTSMTIDAMLFPLSQPPVSLPPPESVVAKVGITKNPAERLCDIFNAFEVFGELQPLLRSLSRSDNPQTAVAKAKSMNEIIFIEKLLTPGNAEHDIRATLQAGQPELPQEFFDKFIASIPQEKKGYLDVVGMTEWLMVKTDLAGMLQRKFRGGGIFELGLVGLVPNGEQLTCAVNKVCNNYYKIPKAPTQASIIMGGQRLPLVIEFKATKFKYQL